MTNDEFFDGLSVAEWEEADAIENEIWKLLGQGSTESVGLTLVRAVLTVRKTVPEATIGTALDTVLMAGSLYVMNEGGTEQRAKPATRRPRKLKSTLK